MMEKKKISPRIEDQSREFLSANFSTLNAGAEYVLDGFPMLYNRALHEIRERCNELLSNTVVFQIIPNPFIRI